MECICPPPPPRGFGSCPFWSGGSAVVDLLFYMLPVVCGDAISLFYKTVMIIRCIFSFKIVLAYWMKF